VQKDENRSTVKSERMADKEERKGSVLLQEVKEDDQGEVGKA